MIKINTRLPVPISEQIKTGFRDLVSRNLLKPGDQVPAVANLAQTLLINPNIVARAYHELIKEGFLNGEPGKAPVISSGSGHQASLDRADLIQKFVLAAQQLLEAGLSWTDLDSALEMVKKQEHGEPTAVRPSGKSLCPYCRSRIVEDAETVSCLICKTIHHRECWDESGRCSVFGCKGKVKLLL